MTLHRLVRRGITTWCLALALFLAAWYGVPALLGPSTTPTAQSTVHPVDRLYAAHHCAPERSAARPLMLIHTQAFGAQLVPPARTAPAVDGQRDWLSRYRASFYGWCAR